MRIVSVRLAGPRIRLHSRSAATAAVAWGKGPRRRQPRGRLKIWLRGRQGTYRQGTCRQGNLRGGNSRRDTCRWAEAQRKQVGLPRRPVRRVRGRRLRRRSTRRGAQLVTAAPRVRPVLQVLQVRPARPDLPALLGQPALPGPPELPGRLALPGRLGLPGLLALLARRWCATSGAM